MTESVWIKCLNVLLQFLCSNISCVIRISKRSKDLSLYLSGKKRKEIMVTMTAPVLGQLYLKAQQ